MVFPMFGPWLIKLEPVTICEAALCRDLRAAVVTKVLGYPLLLMLEARV
jgi:hypothetical protein